MTRRDNRYIILDVIFVKILNRGVSGAVWATVITQIICCIGCCIYFVCRKKELNLRINDFAYEKETVVSLLRNGISLGCMLSFVLLGSLVLQTAINELGTDIIVAHTAARRITILALIPFFSIGAAMSTFCGQNKGAKKPERIREGVTNSIMISAVLFILPAVIYILRNCLQGLGDTKTPLISSLIKLFGKIIITYTLVETLGYFGVIIAEPIAWAVMVIPLIVKWKGQEL